MENTIKLIISDMDDTLLHTRGHIPEKNLRVLNAARQAGIGVTLASGRMFSAMREVAEELKVTLPLIAYNGAMVRLPDPPGTILAHHTLKEHQVRMILDLLSPFDTHINAYLDDVLYSRSDNLAIQKYAKKQNLRFQIIEDFRSLPSLNLTKLLVIEDRPELMGEIRKALNTQTEAEICYSAAHYCEVLPRGVSKGTGLEFLCRYLGIETSQVIAFGDQENDIPMLETAGIGVAMGNAQPAVKAAADVIARENDQDGLAETLLDYLPELKDLL